MNTLRWLCVLWLLPALALAQESVAPVPVSGADRAAFDQEKAAAHLRELQERMFQLGQTLREQEPNDAARLLMAVQRAREELILEQMQQTLTLLRTGDLAHASQEQERLIGKLQELRELLLSLNVDFQVRLDRLRKLRQAMKKLDAAIAEERRQAQEAEQLSQQEQPRPGEFERLDAEQRRNQAATQSVAQTARGLGEAGQGASRKLDAAAQDMGQASKRLTQKDAGHAQKQQRSAVEKMEQARDMLDAERRRLEEELRGEVERLVMDNLTLMLERQTALREATEKLSDRAQPETVKPLAAQEEKLAILAAQTSNLVTDTGWSLVLPLALESIQGQMLGVTADLRVGLATQPVIDDQRAIEAALRELLDTLKQAASNRSANPQQGQCGQCGADKNAMLAELRMIRLLQSRVNDQTARADAQRPAAAEQARREAQALVRPIHKQQEAVRDAMRKLHQSVCPHCAEGGS